MNISRVIRFLIHSAPDASDTERPVRRWVLRLAYAMPLVILPACLWRLPFAVHFDMGQDLKGVGMPTYWLSIPYVLGLSVMSELIAFLCIGLVRRWGEVAPGWIPFIGGRRVRPLAAFVPALLGGMILTVLFVGVPIGDGQDLTLYGVVDSQPYDNAWWKALALICTRPLGLWGPAVIVLAVAYYLRRRPESKAPTVTEPLRG